MTSNAKLAEHQAMFLKVSWCNCDPFEVTLLLVWMTSDLGQQIAYWQVLTSFSVGKKGVQIVNYACH